MRKRAPPGLFVYGDLFFGSAGMPHKPGILNSMTILSGSVKVNSRKTDRRLEKNENENADYPGAG